MTPPRRDWSLSFALLVTLIAAGWRLVDVAEWPSPFHPTIQYESALAARALWCAADPHARTPDRAAWFDAVGFTHVVSPPVLPALVAGVYAATGEEVPWASKFFATAFWLAAGWCVRASAIRTSGSAWAGTAAFAWFVLTPFGVKLARSFQTEPVLVCTFAAAVWLLVRLDRPGWRATLAAGAACGVAAFVKPGVLFAPLAAGFAGVLLSAPTPHRLPKLAAFTLLLVLPSLAYAAVMLTSHVGNKVMPELLLTGWYYESVEKLTATVVGYPALGLMFTGIALAVRQRSFLLPGLLAGYVAYLGVFTFHCATHDYYHAPLLVIAAVAAAGPLGRCAKPQAATPFAACGVALALTVAYLVAMKNPHLGPWRWTPTARVERNRRAEEQSRHESVYDMLGTVTGPGAGAIVLGDAYGYPLEYRVHVRRAFWPRPGDVPVLVRGGQLPEPFTAEGYLRELVGRGFAYFAVTDLAAFAEQPELRGELAKRGRPVASGPGWVLFELRPPADSK